MLPPIHCGHDHGKGKHDHDHDHDKEEHRDTSTCQHISATKVGCFSIIHDHRRSDCFHDCIHPNHDPNESGEKDKSKKPPFPKLQSGLK